MGSPLSFGDCWELAKKTYKIYKFFHDAPEDIDSAGRTVKRTAILLEQYSDPGTHPPHLNTEKGKPLADLINEETKVLKKTLVEIKQLFRQYKIVSSKTFKKILFVSWHLNDIKSLQQALQGQNDSIDKLLRRANDAGVNIHPLQMQELMAQFALVKGKLEVYEKKSKAPALDEKRIRDIFKKLDDEKKSAKTQKIDPSERTKLVTDLSAAGCTVSEADNMVANYSNEATRLRSRIVAAPTPQQSSSSPSLSVPNAKGNAKPKSRSASPSSPGSKSPNSRSPSPKVTPKAQQQQQQQKGQGQGQRQGLKVDKPTILFVDRTHGALALMAHLYAELVRAWSANHGQPWLFKRAAAAGLMVDSEFRRTKGKLLDSEHLLPAGGPLLQCQMDTLFYGETDFWSANAPNEKQAILERLQQRRVQGLPVEMARCEYIVCFDDDTQRALTRLHGMARKHYAESGVKLSVRTGIVTIKNCPDPAGEDNLPKVVHQLRQGLKQFFEKAHYMAWKRPPGSLTGGKFRTAFVQLRLMRQVNLLMDEDSAGLQRLQDEFKCKLNVAHDSRWYGWVLAITGPVEALPKVKEKVTKILDDDD